MRLLFIWAREERDCVEVMDYVGKLSAVGLGSMVPVFSFMFRDVWWG